MYRHRPGFETQSFSPYVKHAGGLRDWNLHYAVSLAAAEEGMVQKMPAWPARLVMDAEMEQIDQDCPQGGRRGGRPCPAVY